MKQSEINIKKPDGKIIHAVSRCKSPDYKKWKQFLFIIFTP